MTVTWHLLSGFHSVIKAYSISYHISLCLVLSIIGEDEYGDDSDDVDNICAMAITRNPVLPVLHLLQQAPCLAMKASEMQHEPHIEALH